MSQKNEKYAFLLNFLQLGIWLWLLRHPDIQRASSEPFGAWADALRLGCCSEGARIIWDFGR